MLRSSLHSHSQQESHLKHSVCISGGLGENRIIKNFLNQHLVQDPCIGTTPLSIWDL